MAKQLAITWQESFEEEGPRLEELLGRWFLTGPEPERGPLP